MDANQHSSNDSASAEGVTTAEHDDVMELRPCCRGSCENVAIKCLEWEDEYCCSDCCVMHCRKVFQQWVAAKKSEDGSEGAQSVPGAGDQQQHSN